MVIFIKLIWLSSKTSFSCFASKFCLTLIFQILKLLYEGMTFLWFVSKWHSGYFTQQSNVTTTIVMFFLLVYCQYFHKAMSNTGKKSYFTQ